MDAIYGLCMGGDCPPKILYYESSGLDNKYGFVNKLSTVYDRIEARAFISYKSFLTRRLNKTGVNLDPGVYFLLATR